MRWVFGIGLILLVMAVMFMVSLVLMMEDEAMEDPEELKEICEACMWREVGDSEPCEKCFIRNALDDYYDDDGQSIIIN